MNDESRIDPYLERLLAEAPTLRAPDRLRAEVATATRHQRQRPAWLISLKEPPMRLRSQLVAGSPTLRLAAVMAATTVLTLAIAGAVIAGSSPQPSPAPAVPPAPTWVSGSILPVDGSCSQLSGSNDVVVRHTAYACTDTWTASDPRLTGEASRPWNEDTYQTNAGEASVGVEAAYLQNEGGAWACWSPYVQEGATPKHAVLDGTFTCEGSGGYEGLTAVLAANTDTGTDAVEFAGLIFSGALPAVPAASAAP